MNGLKISVFLTVTLLLIFTQAHSAPFNYQFSNFLQQYHKFKMESLNSNIAEQTSTEVSSGKNWTLEINQRRIIMIPMDGIVIPVEITKPSYVAKNEDARITFQDGNLRSLTRTKAVVQNYPTTKTYNYRPTLFITLSGLQWDGNGWAEWQDDIESELQKITTYQYNHFLVHWDTEFSMREQVSDLSSNIKEFLSSRTYDWDVVVIGHSRGGVFAHELSKHLVGNSKIKNLHTFLIDPTAATLLGDYYPRYKYNKSPTNHFGSLYFDSSALLDLSPTPFHLNVAVFSDTTISGYNNYGQAHSTNPHHISSTHTQIPLDWINSSTQGFSVALGNIQNNKTIGTYSVDGQPGLHIVLIDVDKGIYVDGDIDVVDGNLVFWGELMVEGVNVVNLNGSIGDDGISAAYGIFLTSAGQVVVILNIT